MLFFPVGKVLKDNFNWLIMAGSIFFLCAVFFYYSNPSTAAAAGEPIDEQLEQVIRLLETVINANPLVGALLIFMNNFLSMMQMLLLGAVLGLSPLLTLGINGALVGTLLAASAGEGMSPLLIIAGGIMPHGIFELFAFFVCGAIGLKFGYHVVASPLPGKTRFESYRYIWKEAISVLPVVVLSLILAAFIEIFFTPRLMAFLL